MKRSQRTKLFHPITILTIVCLALVVIDYRSSTLIKHEADSKKKSNIYFKSKTKKVDKVANKKSAPKRSLNEELKRLEPEIPMSVLIKITQILKETNESCEKKSKEIFSDQNYVDPDFELYQDKDRLLIKISQVFELMLLNVNAKKAFEILSSEVEQYDSQKAPKRWDEALQQLNVCRENEIFYFFETIFESFNLKKLAQEDIVEVNRYFLSQIKLLLGQQQTMSNLIFAANLVNKSARSFSHDSYLVDESKRIFEELIDYWRHQRPEKGSLEANNISFYRDYLSYSEFFSSELNKLIEGLVFY